MRRREVGEVCERSSGGLPDLVQHPCGDLGLVLRQEAPVVLGYHLRRVLDCIAWDEVATGGWRINATVASSNFAKRTASIGDRTIRKGQGPPPPEGYKADARSSWPPFRGEAPRRPQRPRPAGPAVSAASPATRDPNACLNIGFRVDVAKKPDDPLFAHLSRWRAVSFCPYGGPLAYIWVRSMC